MTLGRGLWDPRSCLRTPGAVAEIFQDHLPGKQKSVERRGHSPEDYSPRVTWISSGPTFDSC